MHQFYHSVSDRSECLLHRLPDYQFHSAGRYCGLRNSSDGAVQRKPGHDGQKGSGKRDGCRLYRLYSDIRYGYDCGRPSSRKNFYTRSPVPTWNFSGHRDTAVYGYGTVCSARPALSL